MLFKFATKLQKYRPAMEATFSLSRHSYTKPIFTPHLHGVHVDPASYRQPPSSLQWWPTPVIRSHRLDALWKPEGHGWGGGKPSKSCPGSQGDSHYKEWAVNSLPETRGANGGKDPGPWAAAFNAKTEVAVCLAGAAIGVLGAMVATPASCDFCPEPIPDPDTDARTELICFLKADLCPREGKKAEDATTHVFKCLKDAARHRIDDLGLLKENARVVVATSKAKEMMEMLDKCFKESTKEALELGLIYVEMLILQGKGDDALRFLQSSDFKKIVERNGSERYGLRYFYEAAAQLFLGSEKDAELAWKKFEDAEYLRRGVVRPEIEFEKLKDSMENLKRRYRHPHWTKFKCLFPG